MIKHLKPLAFSAILIASSSCQHLANLIHGHQNHEPAIKVIVCKDRPKLAELLAQQKLAIENPEINPHEIKTRMQGRCVMAYVDELPAPISDVR